MALKGLIKEFGLPEILQLIFHQKKEGILVLEKDDITISILFKEGSVIQAYEGLRDEELGQNLLNASILSDDQLAIASYRRENTHKSLAGALVDLEFISAQELKRLIRLFTEERIFKLFEWQSGNYEFKQKDIEYNPSLTTPLDTQFILMEAARQIDEWPLLLKKIDSRESIFIKIIPHDTLSAPEEQIPVDGGSEAESSFGSMGDSENDESEETLWLQEQIDGLKSVQDIIDKACLGAFSVYQGLNDLVAEGKIKEEKRESLATNETDEKLHLPLKKIIKCLVGGGVSVLVVVIFFLSYPSIQLTSLHTEKSFKEVKNLADANEWHLIRYALKLYYLKHSRYPETLQILLDEGLLGRKEELRTHLKNWSYHTEVARGDRFHLALQ